MSYQQITDKSTGAALVLTFLFGPLGLFYFGAGAGFLGVLLFGIEIICAFLVWLIIPIFILIAIHVGVMVWAATKAGKQHAIFQLHLFARHA
jgi:hypothetical protein